MNKPTTTDREWKQLRTEQDRKIPQMNGYGYYFRDFVVVRVNQFKPGAQLRTVVIRTGASWTKDQDTARCMRFMRRLRKWAGVKAMTDFPRGRECDGIFGTSASRAARHCRRPRSWWWCRCGSQKRKRPSCSASACSGCATGWTV